MVQTKKMPDLFVETDLRKQHSPWDKILAIVIKVYSNRVQNPIYTIADFSLRTKNPTKKLHKR